MRQQLLTGYVLHQKPYQDNRSLTYFFSKEYGLVHGVGKKNLPLFVPISVFATGKSSLKNFSQHQLLPTALPYQGQILFAGLYLNEILLKLLSLEESCPRIWLNYQQCLNQFLTLQVNSSEYFLIKLKFFLRRFEILLFDALGYGLNFLQDNNGQVIDTKKYYAYQWQVGFVVQNNMLANQKKILTGKQLQQWSYWLADDCLFLQTLTPKKSSFAHHLLQVMGEICKYIVDILLNHQPLISRQIWQQMLNFSKQT